MNTHSKFMNSLTNLSKYNVIETSLVGRFKNWPPLLDWSLYWSRLQSYQVNGFGHVTWCYKKPPQIRGNDIEGGRGWKMWFAGCGSYCGLVMQGKQQASSDSTVTTQCATFLQLCKQQYRHLSALFQCFFLFYIT